MYKYKECGDMASIAKKKKGGGPPLYRVGFGASQEASLSSGGWV
jgi:hypothetical protein